MVGARILWEDNVVREIKDYQDLLQFFSDFDSHHWYIVDFVAQLEPFTPTDVVEPLTQPQDKEPNPCNDVECTQSEEASGANHINEAGLRDGSRVGKYRV